MSDQKKRTVVVKGGPGTGKTVVAINLLAKLTNEGLFAQYTSKNSAPRNVYAKKLTGHKKTSINNMFEFDYAGVIIGDDMRFENGHIVTDFTKRTKTDGAFGYIGYNECVHAYWI